MTDGSTNIFTHVYGAINASGVLDLPLARRAFLASYFTYKSLLEDPFKRLLARYPTLLHGGHVIDVGANVGYTAKLFSGYLSPGFAVHAFEPDPTNARDLRSIVAATAHRQRIHTYEKAVGESDGETSLWINPKHHADHRVVTDSLNRSLTAKSEVRRVPLISLGTFWRTVIQSSPVSFVKIDVQGFEIPVLRGMRSLIAGCPTLKIALEYDPKSMSSLGFTPDELLNLTRELGFSHQLISAKGVLYPFQPAEAERLISVRGYCDILLSRP